MLPSTGWLNLPNRITLARLLIAVLLFAMLSLEIAEFGIGDRRLVLNLAFVIFILCVATDWLDGWLARRHGLVTAFGRIADPFVDKIVVCGTFIYLVRLTEMIKPWYAVIIVAREFLVSGLRSYMESQGIPFGAKWGGKIKMILQSITIPCVLFYEANYATRADGGSKSFFYWLAWSFAAATLYSTIASAVTYVFVARRALGVRQESSPADGEPGP